MNWSISKPEVEIHMAAICFPQPEVVITHCEFRDLMELWNVDRFRPSQTSDANKPATESIVICDAK